MERPPGRPRLPRHTVPEVYPHPGIRLGKVLDKYQVTARGVSNLIGVYEDRLARVCRGEIPLTNELAVLLGHAFNERAETWAYEQAMHSLAITRRQMGQLPFKPIPKPISLLPAQTAGPLDRCICGHWGWEHVDYPDGSCIGTHPDDGSTCGCPIYIRLGGYLASKGADKGIPTR